MPTPEAIEAQMLSVFASEAVRQRALMPRVEVMCAEILAERADHRSWRTVTARRLRAILEHARATVPRYRGIGGARLEGFPTVTKENVRDAFVDYVSDDIAQIPARRVRTSGTSGVPGIFLHDDALDVAGFAAARLEKANRLLGTPSRILRPFQTWPLSFHVLEAPAISDNGLAVFGASREPRVLEPALHAARVYSPTILHGHPSQLADLAVVCESSGVRFSSCRVVYTYGERLSPGTRTHLENAFGSPVIDAYGLREFGEVAGECRPGVLRVLREKAIVEILDENDEPVRHGVEGEITVTGLRNVALPLIRYRTGDRGRLVGDPDGMFQELELTTGRMLATINVGGSAIELTKLVHALRGQSLKRYQVVRTGDSSLEFRVTAGMDPLPRAAIEAELATQLGSTITFAVREVTEDDYILSSERKLSDYVDSRVEVER